MHWTEKFKKTAIITDKNQKPKTNFKKQQTAQDTKTEKLQFQKKKQPKIGQIKKNKNPSSPLQQQCELTPIMMSKS